jgi:hypothetical protein
VHGAIARKDITQRAEARVGVAQMVEHACANDLVERLAKLADALDRKPVELQISYVVFVLKIARMAQACFAEVDRRHARFGLHKRVPRGLRRSASSDQDRSIWAWLLQRPQQQGLRAPPAWIAVALKQPIEAGDGRRIGVRLVEGADRLDAPGRQFRIPARRRHLAVLKLRDIGIYTEARFDRRFDSDYRKQPESILVNTVASCVAKMLNLSRIVYRSVEKGSAL